MKPFSELVAAEFARSRAKFPKRQHSVAEAREVIREEFEEFVESSRIGPQYAPIPLSSPSHAIAANELVQLAAMCYRTAIECYGFPEEDYAGRSMEAIALSMKALANSTKP